MKVTLKVEKEFNIKKLHVKAGVRYWSSAYVDGVEDFNRLIPCIVGDYWSPIINVETGIIENWEIGKTADVHYKVCDDGEYALYDDKDIEILSVSGYVVDCMCPEGNGYGDYIIMKIDENGKIANWKFSLGGFMEEED